MRTRWLNVGSPSAIPYVTFLKGMKSQLIYFAKKLAASLPMMPSKVRFSLLANDFGPFSKFHALLYDIILLYKPKIVVELGTGEGNCMGLIGIALKKNGVGKLYTHDSYGERILGFIPKHGKTVEDKIRILNIDEFVQTVRCDVFSHTWTQGPIDLLVVDIDNTFERLRQLHDKWFVYVSKDGMIVLEGGFSTYENKPREIGKFTAFLRDHGWETFTFKHYPGAVIGRRIGSDDRDF
ncbi:MAG TPA: class I SAM-dependent methyltransferase [Bacteroidota bacterium]